MPHTFTTGQFEKFRALNNFHLGPFTLDVRGGAEFEFDGVTLRYMGRDYNPIPQLQGMLEKGWYVPVADQTSVYRPRPAGVEVHPADTTQPQSKQGRRIETYHEEVEVGTVAGMAARREGRVAPPLPVDAPDGRAEVVRPNRLPVDVEDEVDVTPARMNPKAAAARQAAQAAQRVAETAQVAAAIQAVPPGIGAMQAQLMASGAYGRLSVADQEAVMRADAANASALAAALAQPVVKPATFGGERHDTLGDESEEGVAIGRGKHRLIRYDGQQGEVVRSIRDTGGAAVGAEGQAVQEVKGVSIFATTGDAILAKQAPIGGGPKPTGQGPNRAVVTERVGPAVPQMRTARSTQIPAEGNIDIGELPEGGATGDAAMVIVSDDLADLLPGAAVAGKATSVPTEKLAREWLQANAKLHWVKRAKAAVDEFRAKPAMLKAICKFEKPGVTKMINDLLKEE